MNFLFQNVTASWMLDWAKSVPQNQVSLKENLGAILTFFTRPVKTWTALSSPRYRWPQCATLASRHSYLISVTCKGSLLENEAPGGRALEKSLDYFLFYRVMAGSMQVVKLTLSPKEMDVPFK